MPSTHRSAFVLAAGLATSGITHLLRPRLFDHMIPPQLPGSARAWTYGSGAAELAVAAAVASPGTRRLGGLAAAALFVGVFPGNVQMTVNAFRRDRPTGEKIGNVVRLPLQAPLVAWALRISRRAA